MLKTFRIYNSLKISNFKFQIILLFTILASCFLLNNSNQALAQATTNQKGITVYPSIAHLDLTTDPPEYDLTYINNTRDEINLVLSVQDFTELEDSYKISFLEGKDASNYKYSLSSWLSFENKNLQLSPGETKSVKVFIDKNRITKGGHYASILAQVNTITVNKQITIKPVLSSLLFVRSSTGKEIEIGKISSFRPARDRFDFPESLTLRFENGGNVHVIPYGIVQIYDPFGNLVAKGFLNEGSLDALPESIRRYDTKVNRNSKFLFPGIYTAKIDIHFGKTNQKLSTSVKFFSQGSLDLIKIAFSIFILIAIIYYLMKRVKKNKEKE